ncbi:GNAT family N-acetyltransferase [Streptomyces sp. NPDC015350]|uniref:GNAT family N-acetyltransferase n=1 Tax=Streptomyces sp. NPDC015350 TaxID=3364955 RepID=UPI0036FCB4EF
MNITVRDACSADAAWMSDNTEQWVITAEPADTGMALTEALHALIAEDSQGTPMGWLYSSQQNSAHGEPGYVRLYEMYVAPEFRRRGVSRALVKELFARVPDQEIVLSAWDRELYEVWLKLGFTYTPGPEDKPGYNAYFGDMARPSAAP